MITKLYLLVFFLLQSVVEPFHSLHPFHNQYGSIIKYKTKKMTKKLLIYKNSNHYNNKQQKKQHHKRYSRDSLIAEMKELNEQSHNGNIHSNILMIKCINNNESKLAIEVAGVMINNQFDFDPQTMTGLLILLVNNEMFVEAESLFKETIATGLLEAHPSHFSPLLRSCGSATKAKELLYMMRMEEIEPNVISYSAAIKSCEKDGDWPSALEFLDLMRANNVEPNEITFSSVISVAARGNVAYVALNVLREMQNNGLKVNEISYGSALLACARGCAWDDVETLLSEMHDTSGEVVITQRMLMSVMSAARRAVIDSHGDSQAIEDACNAAMNLIENWAQVANANEGLYSLAMDLMLEAGYNTLVQQTFQTMLDDGVTPGKGSLSIAMRAINRCNDLEGLCQLLFTAHRNCLATTQMYNKTITLADQMGRSDIAVALLVDLLDDNEDNGHNLGLQQSSQSPPLQQSQLKQNIRIKMPPRFIINRVLSNALIALTQNFRTNFLEVVQGRLEPVPELKSFCEDLSLALSIEGAFADPLLRLRPNAYPMAMKLLLDEEDFESLRFHLNQTLYIPTVNSTRLYEFGIKGLTFIFPLRDGVSTIIDLLEDCASVQPRLAEVMATLAMNKIFNAPPHTRSNIDRRMFPTTGKSSNNNNHNNNINNYNYSYSNNGNTKVLGMKVSSSRKGKLQLYREKQDTYSNTNTNSNTIGRFVDVSRNDAEKQIRTGTRERLLVHLFQRIRQLLGPERTPRKCYRLALLACQKANLPERALLVYRQLLEDCSYNLNQDKEKKWLSVDAVCHNAAMSTLARSVDHYDTALDIFSSIPESKLDSYNYVAALVACETGLDWERACYIMNKAKESGHGWTTSMVTTAIAACGASGRANEALRILENAAGSGVPLNVISFNAAVFACAGAGFGLSAVERAETLLYNNCNDDDNDGNYNNYVDDIDDRDIDSIVLWKEAEDLVMYMKKLKIYPNRITYNAVIEALGAANQTTLIDHWYLDGVTAGLIQPFRGLERHGWIDLHYHSVHMARAAVRMTFETIYALYCADALPVDGRLIFIVGKGRKLLAEINKQLKTEFDPPIQCHVRSQNLGRLLTNESDVINWLEKRKEREMKINQNQNHNHDNNQETG